MAELTTFELLNKIDLSDKTKEKIGLKYLSWAYAWGELKKVFPNAFYTIYTRTVETKETVITCNPDGSNKTIEHVSSNEVLYFTDGLTCHVKVGVTINDVEYIEYLPVMDNKNNAVRIETITSTAVNKALQRAFVKACARHGLGLYIYAGEDLPEDSKKNINFVELTGRANAASFTDISEEAFNIAKQNVITSITKFASADKAIYDGIVTYTQYLFPGVKLSAATYASHAEQMMRLNYFLVDLTKVLNE